ncbi:hypothetical protein [Paratractidigestivibacter faecalis]|uniref:hypothetical protein n=1 Tax=Paratractidigestivibacter faecalis TaxID=2292441 RepID=UPI00388EC121
MLIYPILGVLAIGVVMLALNPLFAWINTALNDFLASLGTSNIVILGMVLGGMMSVDMGSPFNKAAYVFGTAAGPDFPRLSMWEAGASSSQAAGPRPSRQKFFAQRNFCEKGGGLRPAMPDPAPFSPVYSDEGNQGRGDQHGG